jgi:hypothetical protein
MRILPTFLLAIVTVTVAHARPGSSSPDGTGVDGHATINGDVSNLCILGVPSPSNVELGQLSSTSGNNIGHLQQIADQLVLLPASFCNYAGTQMTVQASALLDSDTSTVESGFTRAVNFTATVSDWGSRNAAVTTEADASGDNPNAADVGGVQDSPAQTDLKLKLSNFTAPGDGFLVAGNYQGSVTVTVGPSTE